MRFILNYAAIVSVALLSSTVACRKEDTPPEPTVQQLVFTNGREITDEAIKKRFVQQSRTPFTSPGAPDPSEYVRFLGPDTAQFLPGQRRFFFTKQGSRYLFYSAYGPAVQNPYNPVRALLKYTATPVPVPMAVGEYISRDVRVGYEVGSTLEFPLLYFRLKRTNGSSPGAGSEEYSGVVFNEFNEDAIAGIRVGDTLAIQVHRLAVPVK